MTGVRLALGGAACCTGCIGGGVGAPLIPKSFWKKVGSAATALGTDAKRPAHKARSPVMANANGAARWPVNIKRNGNPPWADRDSSSNIRRTNT